MNSRFRKIITCALVLCLCTSTLGVVFATEVSDEVVGIRSEIQDKYITGYGDSTDEIVNDAIEYEGDIISVGYVEDDEGNTMALISRVDDQGRTVGTTFGNEGYSTFTSIGLSKEGGYIITGGTDSDSWLNDDTSMMGNGKDAFIIHMDQNFQIYRYYRFNGDKDEYLMDVAVNGDTYYAVGYTNSSNIDNVNNSNDKYCGFVTKFNYDIELEEVKGLVDQDFSQDVTLHKIEISSSGLIVGGNTASTNLAYGYTRKGVKNGIVIRYDHELNRKWVKSYGSNNPAHGNRLDDMLVDGEKIIVAGVTFVPHYGNIYYTMMTFDKHDGRELDTKMYTYMGKTNLRVWDLELASFSDLDAQYIITINNTASLLDGSGKVISGRTLSFPTDEEGKKVCVVTNKVKGYDIIFPSKYEGYDTYNNMGGYDLIYHNYDETLHGLNFDMDDAPINELPEVPVIETDNPVCDLEIIGDFKATVLTFSVPTTTTFVVNPNEKKYEDMFISPKFIITNLSSAPILMGVEKFATAPDSAYDFEEYVEYDSFTQSEWEKFNIYHSRKYFSLNIRVLNPTQWVECWHEFISKSWFPADGSSYDDSWDGDKSNNMMEVGVIGPNSKAAFTMDGKHGTSFDEVLSTKHIVTFIFGLVED